MSQKQAWQEALSDLITDPKELFTLLELDPHLLDKAHEASRVFPFKVPRGFVARMQKGNINDPLLQQVLPLGIELMATPGYEADPLQESAVNPVPGLLQKYKGRVLVTLTSACAIHCRYCFRRNFPYEKNNPGRAGWEKIMAYIQNDSSIHEVILSGGDPLSVNDTVLQAFCAQIIMIPHVTTLRFHTRLPVVLPERITNELVTWLQHLRLRVVMVIHANHPQEINTEVVTALAKLKQAGVHLLNQSVLLKEINDDPEILRALSITLFNAGVMPYYLHVLDKVQGVAHFDLPKETARTIYQALRATLPGYLVPQLVCEEPGANSKTNIMAI